MHRNMKYRSIQSKKYQVPVVCNDVSRAQQCYVLYTTWRHHVVNNTHIFIFMDANICLFLTLHTYMGCVGFVRLCIASH